VAQADGSIIIDTGIDTSGMQAGSKKIEQAARRIAKSIGDIGKKTELSINNYLNSRSVKDGISSIGRSLSSIKSIVSSTNRSFSKLNRTIKRVGYTLAAAFSIGSLFNFAKETTQLGSDLQEVQNVVDVTFTSMSDKVDEFAKKAAVTAGLSETMAKQYIGTFGAMSKSFGFTEKDAYDMSTALTQLSGDVASFYNISQDLAYTKLKSVFTGETETLKDLGIVMTQAALDQYALSNGFGKTTKQMTEQEKVALRYQFVMQQLSGASGDFIRTADGWANQVRVLKLQFDSLKATIGQGLINVLTPVIHAINLLLSKLAALANSFKSFTELLIGKKSSSSSGSKTSYGGVSDIENDYDAASESAEKFADSTQHVADTTKKAKKEAEKYLSPLDEINKYQTEISGINSSPGDYAGSVPSMPQIDDIVDTGEIGDKTEGIFDKIKSYIKEQDWEGLGGYIAGGINKGLQKVYKLISWDNVGPKVRGFVIPFTTTFNSIVDLMDWDRLGRTVGAGVKTITRSVNMLADNIDWVNLGSKISTGFKGLLDEVDWNDFGHLIGQKFKIAWDLFYGFVKDPELFGKIGKAVADGFTGLTDTIPFGGIGLAFAYGINDAFDFLAIFARTFPWDTFANNVKNGITNFLEKTNWSENGEKLGNFILHLAETLRMMLDKDTFYKFGNAVGEFLGALPWDEILKEAAGFMIDALVGLFSGLKDSGNAGKIASYLGEMFLAVKVANITGISKLVTLLIKRIVKNFGLSSNTKQVSDAIENTIGKGIKDAASNLDGLSKAAGKTAEGVSGISSALNTLALGAGIVGTIELTKNLAGMADAARGGNGYLTELGGGIEGLTEKLKLSKGITKEQSDELFLLKESLEDANASPEEFASAFVDAFGKMGISSEDARLALLNLGSQVTLSADQAKMLELIVSGLGDSTQTMASKINLAGIDSEEAYGKMYSALDMLYGQAKITDTQLSYLQTQFALQYPAVQSAQEGYELLSDLLQSQGVDAATTAQIIGELFPEAVKTAEKSTTESMKNIDKASGEAMEATEGYVKNASDNISKGVSNSMALSQKSVKDATGEIAKTTKDEWSNSQDSVTTNLSGIEQSTKETMRDVAAIVRTYWDSVQINTNRVWTEMGEKILGTMRNVIIKVNSMIRNINASIAGVERAFTFSYDMQNPLTGARSYGNYWMNLPRVNSIPYLATGAVIPPNREFMAVLGDQKHGTNIEAPESLIRKIVREESGGSGNANYQFQAVLNRRVIFDEMIKEAELRQQSSGLNPFELS